MSGWEAYTNSLMAKNCFTNVAICGLTDGSLWAATAGLKGVSQEEILKIATGFKNAGSDLSANGVFVAGRKYMFLQHDANLQSIQAKLRGQGQISICKAKTCFIIGQIAEGQQPGNANKEAGVMADYLRGLDF